MNNVFAYSLQVLLIIAGGSLLPWVFRLNVPKARLWFWQGLLTVCLLLPVVQPRRASSVDFAAAEGPVQAGIPIEVHRRKALPMAEILTIVYAAGISLRAVWLVLGLWRLRRYRRNAIDLSSLSPRLLAAQQRLLTFPDIRLSPEITSPVAFGLLKPAILLPPNFLDFNEGAQEAILAHELIHVRGRDWTFIVLEEIVRSVFWPHPAMWWLLAQIQLTREQAVDRAAIEFTQSREQYLEALLAAASAKVQPDLALAPLFLRKRHLARRVSAILKEVRMSKRQVISSLASVFTLAFVLAQVATLTFPLASTAQDTGPNQSAGVTVDTQGHKLLHGPPIEFPRKAIEKHVEGTVVLELNLNAQGEVSDARVESGPDELRSVALSSALLWHFAAVAGQSTIHVSVNFKIPMGYVAEAPKPSTPHFSQPAVLRKIEYVNVPGILREALKSSLSIREGDSFDPGTWERLKQEIMAVDEHLRPAYRMNPQDGSATLYISLNNMAVVAVGPSQSGQPTSSIFATPVTSATPKDAVAAIGSPAPPAFNSEPVEFNPPRTEGVQRIRVGGQVEALKLIEKVPPQYPPLAKQARIQGVVRFHALIGKEGTIQALQLVSGHPLLIPPAEAAVQQWKYEPTLLKGDPVEVETVIDINFTLSE